MRSRTLGGLITIGLVSLFLISSPGCVRLAANLVNAIQGNEKPAEYNGLEKKRVAIICATDKGLSSDASAALLTGYVHMLLNKNVKGIELVRAEEVERWLDAHGTIESDYVQIGKGVKADEVVAIDLAGMKIKDGATLYRGQCDISVTVFDIVDEGAIVFKKQFPEFSFPKMGGPTTSDTTDAKFRNMFLTVVAAKVAGLFYAVDPTAEYALDATANSF